jgi:hypothetical protein
VAFPAGDLICPPDTERHESFRPAAGTYRLTEAGTTGTVNGTVADAGVRCTELRGPGPPGSAAGPRSALHSS